jgi:hypothetical protein
MPTKKLKPKKQPECCEDDLSRELFFVWRSIMAKLSDVNDAIAAQTVAIQALADAIAAKPPAAATEADLDGVKAGIDANTAAVQAIPTT